MNKSQLTVNKQNFPKAISYKLKAIQGFTRTLILALFRFCKKVLLRIRVSTGTFYPPLFYGETKKATPNLVSGFTLVEMVVVMGIFALLTSTLFINYSQFSVNASLNNLTHQIALIARQAQVYGISVSQASVGSQKFKGYGVYFSTASADDQKTVILFNDWNPVNKKYDPIAGPCTGLAEDECQEKISIQSGDMVEKIMANEKTSASGTELNDISVVFTRPNPEANFVAFRKDDPETQFVGIADLEVYLISTRGTEKKVVIWSTGQIAVE